MLRKDKVFALDRLLLERFGGNVGRGLAVELCARAQRSALTESLFAPVLTVYSQGSENLSEMGDNAGANKCL
jgi:hypothetical protein